MPVQQFAPMTKDFPTFDCDAHVTESPWLWERAKDYLTKDEFEALKGSFCFDPESNRLIANGLGYAGPTRSRCSGALISNDTSDGMCNHI